MIRLWGTESTFGLLTLISGLMYPPKLFFFQFIENGVEKGVVLVHCFYGKSRSASVILAYLMTKYRYENFYDFQLGNLLYFIGKSVIPAYFKHLK